MHARRPEQNLTCLAQGVSGSVLLPVISRIRRSHSRLRGKRVGVLVKKVRISSCTTTFCFRFPILACIVRQESHLGTATSKNARWETTRNGRERPHFFGFNPPKKFSRSLPPVSIFRIPREHI